MKQNGDQTGIDIGAISEEYIESHRENGNNIYFISNYYSDTKYGGYAESGDELTRDDLTVSFSPSESNRYYIFRKPRPLYAHAYRIGENGTNEIEGNTDGAKGGASWSGGLFTGVYNSPYSFKLHYFAAIYAGKKIIKDDEGNSYTLPENADWTDCVVFLKNDALTNVTQEDTGAYTDGSVSFAPEDYFFLTLDYYLPTGKTGVDKNGNPVTETTGAVALQYVVTRRGSEFGSLGSTEIEDSEMLCWTDLNGNFGPDLDYIARGDNTHGKPTCEKLFGMEGESEPYWADIRKLYEKEIKNAIDIADKDNDRKISEDEFNEAFNFAVAAKPGGLRIGDMYQNRKGKGKNNTKIADTYYVPTIADTSVIKDKAIINNYLGNNGRLAIPDNVVLVTKTVNEWEGDVGTSSDATFNYQVYIEGFSLREFRMMQSTVSRRS